MWLLGLFRPFAVALGLFLVLNAGASCARPSLGAGRLVVNLPIPEPYLSLGLAACALCILFPFYRSHLRGFQLAVLLVFALAVVANVIRYYLLVDAGRINTSLPVPFSAFVLAIILVETLRLSLQLAAALPVVLQVALVPIAFFLLVAAHIVTYGHTDYRAIANAEAAVILGARVNDNGSVSEALQHRLLTGIELGLEHRVKYLIMTGGTGPNGVNEAEAMARFAEARGVPRVAIVLDRGGVNTFASAVNCAALCRQHKIQRVMVVSQYYHLARIKLIFERQGLSVLTVPARVDGEIRQNMSALARETAALPYYYLCCTFGEEVRG